MTRRNVKDGSTPQVDLRSGYEACYYIAPAEEWVTPDGPRFRVTRIPRDDNAPMRTEMVPERSLGTMVELLARGDFYTVLICKDEE